MKIEDYEPEEDEYASVLVYNALIAIVRGAPTTIDESGMLHITRAVLEDATQYGLIHMSQNRVHYFKVMKVNDADIKS